MKAEEVIAKMDGLQPGHEVYIEWLVVVSADADGTFTVADTSDTMAELTADEVAEMAALWATENRNRHTWAGGAE